MLAFGMSAYLSRYAPEKSSGPALSPAIRQLDARREFRCALDRDRVARPRIGLDGRGTSAPPSTRERDQRGARRHQLRPCLGGASRARGGAPRNHRLRPAQPVGGDPALASAAVLASLGLVGHAAMQTGAEGVLHRANHAVHLLTTGPRLAASFLRAGAFAPIGTTISGKTQCRP